jgi:hypothetical protein
VGPRAGLEDAERRKRGPTAQRKELAKLRKEREETQTEPKNEGRKRRREVEDKTKRRDGGKCVSDKSH